MDQLFAERGGGSLGVVVMIYSFHSPHKIGSVCRYPCAQCKDQGDNLGSGKITDAHGNFIGYAPLYIVRCATFEEWRAEVISEGGKVDRAPILFSYFYEVSSD